MPAVPTRRDWPRLLRELARQVDGGLVYNRDLPALAEDLRLLLERIRRRQDLKDRRAWPEDRPSVLLQ